VLARFLIVLGWQATRSPGYHCSFHGHIYTGNPPRAHPGPRLCRSADRVSRPVGTECGCPETPRQPYSGDRTCTGRPSSPAFVDSHTAYAFTARMHCTVFKLSPPESSITPEKPGTSWYERLKALCCGLIRMTTFCSDAADFSTRCRPRQRPTRLLDRAVADRPGRDPQHLRALRYGSNSAALQMAGITDRTGRRRRRRPRRDSRCELAQPERCSARRSSHASSTARCGRRPALPLEEKAGNDFKQRTRYLNRFWVITSVVHRHRQNLARDRALLHICANRGTPHRAARARGIRVGRRPAASPDSGISRGRSLSFASSYRWIPVPSSVSRSLCKSSDDDSGVGG